MENYLLVAGLIEAHPDHEIAGRTRLQKTVRLLQRAGIGTDYVFSIHSYGPYSDELNSDIGTIKMFGLGDENCREGQGGSRSAVIRVTPTAHQVAIDRFRDLIRTLAATDVRVLDIAATYDTFREMGSDHAEALCRLQTKKGARINSESVGQALSILRALGLPAPEYARQASR